MNATLTTTQLHPHRTHTAALVVALLALAAALAGLGYAVQHALTQSTTTTAVAVVPAHAWTADYAQGSTTYAEQVPALAAEYQSIAEGYGVGSTTWAEQIGWAPAVRTLPHGVAPLEAEAVSWTSSYGPTSTVYSEQVPHGAAPFEWGTPALPGTGTHPVLNAGALEALTSA